MKWVKLLEALRKGAVLKNPAAWKNAQMLSTAIVSLLISGWGVGVAFGWFPAGVDETQLTEIGSSLGVLLFGIVSIYATVASSDKVGLPAKPADSGSGELRESEGQAEDRPVSADDQGSGASSGGFPKNQFLE